MIRFRLPTFLFGPRRRKPASEETFARRVDHSEMLQHLCGFDTELYAAMRDLDMGLDMNGVA